MNRPRLRDGRRLTTPEPFPLNQIPRGIILSIGGYFVYLLHTGHRDITGSNWGDALAYAVEGRHLDSPLGIVDVVLENNSVAWSAKTIKIESPHAAQNVRLISGRCSPDYSYGITDPHEDIQRTGNAVLNIWNERINIAREQYNAVRTSVLIRSNDLTSFRLFEEENQRFRISDFIWEQNPNGNLIGKNRNTQETRFTWQPHGSQLTIHTQVPESAIRFRIRRPPIVTPSDVLRSLHFDQSWIEILDN